MINYTLEKSREEEAMDEQTLATAQAIDPSQQTIQVTQAIDPSQQTIQVTQAIDPSQQTIQVAQAIDPSQQTIHVAQAIENHQNQAMEVTDTIGDQSLDPSTILLQAAQDK